MRSALICGLAGAILFGLAFKKIDPLPLSPAPLEFNARNAFDWMSDLSKKFPYRTTWSDSRRHATVWLKGELAKMGYQPKGMLFSEDIAGKEYSDLENVYAEKIGTKHPDQIIVMAAHYDIVDTTKEGAMDDASGVGVVLELARIFSKIPTDRTLVFLLTDSEEYGAFWGARAFASQYEHANQIVAAANFDFVAPEKQAAIITLCDGLHHGFTPLWLRELALDSLRSISGAPGGGFEVRDMTNFMEFALRAIQIPPSDHGAFLRAGIPSFNWVGQTSNFSYEMAHYHHTDADTVDAMHVESFDTYGRAAERLIRSIDRLPSLPTNWRDSSYWKISARYYLDGWAVKILHFLLFIPFLTYSFVRFGATLRTASAEDRRLALGNEGKNIAILLGSLLLGYGVIRLLPALRIITQYEIFPATQKSLILYNPDFLAMLLVVACVVLVYVIFSRTFREKEDSVGYPELRQAIHAAFLALIVLVGLLKNSSLTVLLLLPPAYLWTAIRSRRTTGDRIMNSVLLLGGAITFITMSIVLSTIFHVGVVYWYMFLSAAYGLISAYAVILFFMALTILIRLFRSFVF